MDLGAVQDKKIIGAVIKTYRDEAIKLGENGVKRIEYHEPCGEGDRHFIDVIGLKGGIKPVRIRYFNVAAIIFEEDEIGEQ